jgi:hypothetical protein
MMRKSVIVNGDDMLFKCTRNFYNIFLEVSKEVGFKISQGKNYLSPDCCMINSQVFKRTFGTMKRFGYLNLKIVKGSSLKGGESNAVPTQLGPDLSRMVERCPWTHCSIPAALNRWKKDWFGPIYRPNWYMPVHLGGFGIPKRFAPPSWKVTRSQRLMAARFVNNPSMALYRRKGMDIPTTKLAGALVNWKMFPHTYVPNKHEIVASDDWLARLAYAARAHSGSKEVSDNIFISRFKPEYRLKPMSYDMLEKYWDAQVYAVQPPTCPPIGYIRLNYVWDYDVIGMNQLFFGPEEPTKVADSLEFKTPVKEITDLKDLVHSLPLELEDLIRSNFNTTDNDVSNWHVITNCDCKEPCVLSTVHFTEPCQYGPHAKFPHHSWGDHWSHLMSCRGNCWNVEGNSFKHPMYPCFIRYLDLHKYSRRILENRHFTIFN